MRSTALRESHLRRPYPPNDVTRFSLSPAAPARYDATHDGRRGGGRSRRSPRARSPQKPLAERDAMSDAPGFWYVAREQRLAGEALVGRVPP